MVRKRNSKVMTHIVCPAPALFICKTPTFYANSFAVTFPFAHRHISGLKCFLVSFRARRAIRISRYNLSSVQLSTTIVSNYRSPISRTTLMIRVIQTDAKKRVPPLPRKKKKKKEIRLIQMRVRFARRRLYSTNPNVAKMERS